MKSSVAVQHVKDIAALCDTSKLDRVTARWSTDMHAAEFYIANNYAPVCGGSWAGAANCSTNSERRGNDEYAIALRFARICA